MTKSSFDEMRKRIEERPESSFDDFMKKQVEERAENNIFGDKDPYKVTYETGVPTEPTGRLIIEDDETTEKAEPGLGYTVESVKEWESDVDYKFEEDVLCDKLLDYIATTYSGHYTGEKYQATDLIIDAGHGEGFCIGNIIKYAKRYGKKDGYNEKDILKILHYGIILWHVHRREGR